MADGLLAAITLALALTYGTITFLLGRSRESVLGEALWIVFATFTAVYSIATLTEVVLDMNFHVPWLAVPRGLAIRLCFLAAALNLLRALLQKP